MKALLDAIETRLLLRRPGWLRTSSAPAIPVSGTWFAVRGLVAMADRKMSFPLGWWDHLDGPAARRQGTLLFERFTHG